MRSYDYWLEGGGDPTGQDEIELLYDKLIGKWQGTYCEAEFEKYPEMKKKFWDYDMKTQEEYNDAIVGICDDFGTELFNPSSEYVIKSVNEYYDRLATEEEKKILVDIFESAMANMMSDIEEERFQEIEQEREEAREEWREYKSKHHPDEETERINGVY